MKARQSGKNGAKRPRLPLRGSWHGEAVTERAVPAAAEDSPCHFVALPPHKCGGQGLSFRCTFHPGDSHASDMGHRRGMTEKRKSEFAYIFFSYMNSI